jgi:hypothetical protein
MGTSDIGSAASDLPGSPSVSSPAKPALLPSACAFVSNSDWPHELLAQIVTINLSSLLVCHAAIISARIHTIFRFHQRWFASSHHLFSAGRFVHALLALFAWLSSYTLPFWLF